MYATKGGAVTFACKSSWQDWQDWYISVLIRWLIVLNAEKEIKIYQSCQRHCWLLQAQGLLPLLGIQWTLYCMYSMLWSKSAVYIKRRPRSKCSAPAVHQQCHCSAVLQCTARTLQCIHCEYIPASQCRCTSGESYYWSVTKCALRCTGKTLHFDLGLKVHSTSVWVKIKGALS